MDERISVAAAGASWAIKHGNGFLGYAPSQDEATSIGRSLVEWLKEQGRSAVLVMEGER